MQPKSLRLHSRPKHINAGGMIFMGQIQIIVEGMTAAVDIIFCFGFAIPTPQMLAVRPRSIGIADMGDKFVISFLEAPMQPANQAMEAWTIALRNA